MRTPVQSIVFNFVIGVAAFCAISDSAQAISLRFKSKIISIGAKIYACNAGIGSEKAQVCYFNNTNVRCTEQTCTSAKQNCNSSCICTGNYGSAIPAALTVRTQSVDNDVNPLGPAGALTTRQAVTTGFSQVVTASQAFNTTISDLSVFFPQDMYTGKYFLDVCYRGSNIPDIKPLYTLTTEASAIPFRVISPEGFNAGENNRVGLDFNNPATLDGQTYTSKSALTVQSFVVCSSNPEVYPDFTVDSTGKPVGGINGVFTASTQALMSSSALEMVRIRISDPKLCKVRYLFTESDYRNPFPRMRGHESVGAEVCTYTSIQDPPEGAPVEGL